MLLLMIACGWWHKANSQSNTGLEQYYYMNAEAITISPKAWYQFKNGWYLEGRYNYEEVRTGSVYIGKTFEHEAAFSYEITPMIGVVGGLINGGAIAENGTARFKKILLSLQSQYTFSIENCNKNFVYAWVDLSYDLFKGLSLGLSMQQTNLYQTKGRSERGFFLKAELGKWEFPVYIFNPSGNNRYMVLGLNYTYR